MADVQKLVVVGVGLLGGSIAKAALARGVAAEVVGVGRNREKLAQAQRNGVVTSATTDMSAACCGADLIVVCTPVDTIAAHVRDAAAACNRPTLITDAGSTKADIVGELPAELPGRCRFVGSHPLAGSEKTGAENAAADLFVGRTVVVTPTDTSRGEDVEWLRAFWTALGASVRLMPPDEHDRALAATSHAPHLIAVALALATATEDLPLTASGWLDTTRIAAADAQLWRPIFAANRANVLKALDEFGKTLASLRHALESESAGDLTNLLAEARRVRKAAEEIRNGNALGS
ncbi:MAG: prephenate dehydrogenase/arogenate dehydrogenase family protein [Pirellulales bacterium]